MEKREVRRGERSLYRGTYFFQAEDGMRDVERSRGLGEVYKGQRLAVYETRC